MCCKKHYDGNLHPLSMMDQKEVRKVERLMKMLYEHLAKPLKYDRSIGMTSIDGAYYRHMETSAQLKSKLEEVAVSVLGEALGIRPGMTVRLSNTKSNAPAVVKIEALRLCHGNELSTSPQEWEWRVFGTLLEHKSTKPLVECSLRDDVTIERLGLNDTWSLVVAPPQNQKASVNSSR